MTKYGHKKKVCLDKTFPLGHFMLHFIMFLIRQMTTKVSNDWCSHVMCCKNVGQQNFLSFFVTRKLSLSKRPVSLHFNINKKRMHSSRMRTGRSLTVCWRLLPGGVSAPGGFCLPGGVWSGGCLLTGGSAPGGCLLPGGLSAQGGLLQGVSTPGDLVWGGGIPACTEADTLPRPCGQNHRRL